MSASVAVLDARRIRRRGQTYVALAAVAWSTAGVLQRDLSVDAATQIAGRAFFAMFALLVFVAFSERGGIVRSFLSMGRAGLSVAVLTAVASSTFITALNYTSVANVLFMQAIAPIVAAVIAWLALHESVTRRSAVAMVIALTGVGVMVGGPGGSRGIGFALSVVMTLAFATALVITRHRRDISMAPAICLSQVIVFVVVAPFSSPTSLGSHDLLVVATLGIGQMGLGLAFLTVGARLIPAAEVALITLLEVVLGPIWVWLVFSEKPSTTTLVGGLIVLLAVTVQTRSEPDDAWSG